MLMLSSPPIYSLRVTPNLEAIGEQEAAAFLAEFTRFSLIRLWLHLPFNAQYFMCLPSCGSSDNMDPLAGTASIDKDRGR